jgi:deazaflavin-dependent oxidoreductase (nitroreductase family)
VKPSPGRVVGPYIERGRVDSLDSMSQPSGILKALFNSPRWFYRHGLGWMMGRRAMALTHRGRKSGTLHETILEVVYYDKDTKESLVGSAYGTDADWYRNIQAAPAVRVRTGRQDYVPYQRFLTREEGLEVARRFCKEHPLEARLVNKVLPAIGSDVPRDRDADPADLLAMLPMVGFRPKT